MNKLIAVVTIVFFLISNYSQAQDRVESLNDALSLMGSTPQKVKSHLSNLGFDSYSKYKNIYEYKKQTYSGEYTYTVAYNKAGKVNVISWSEHLVFLRHLQTELFTKGFEENGGDPYTGMYSFKNNSRKLVASLIIPNGRNSVDITIGYNR